MHRAEPERRDQCRGVAGRAVQVQVYDAVRGAGDGEPRDRNPTCEHVPPLAASNLDYAGLLVLGCIQG